MNVHDILIEERKIWGDTKQTLEHVAICIGKMQGDVAAQARSKIEKGQANDTEIMKELGNIISSTVRYVDDLGYDIEECLRLAFESQRKYQK